MADSQDIDPEETQEWLDALDAVIANEGPERAHYLMQQLVDSARRNGAHLPRAFWRLCVYCRVWSKASSWIC